MIAHIFIFPTDTIKPPLRVAIDPVEHAVHTIDSAVNTILSQIHLSNLQQVQRIEQHLKSCAIGVLQLQDVAAHREHSLMGGH